MNFLGTLATTFLLILLMALLVFPLLYGVLLVCRSMLPKESPEYATASHLINKVSLLFAVSARFAAAMLFFGTIILFGALALYYG
jgi:hypothetical protein